MEDYHISRSEGPVASFQNHVASLHASQDFTDVTLVCKDFKPLQLHRVVLSASSLWFRFENIGSDKTSHFVQSRELLPKLPDKPTIYLPNIDHFALTPLLAFIYQARYLSYTLEIIYFFASSSNIRHALHFDICSAPRARRRWPSTCSLASWRPPTSS